MTTPEDIAQDVEAARVETAHEVEIDRVDLAEQIEELRRLRAVDTEEIRKLHNTQIEIDRRRRARVVDRQFWFLFIGGVAAFLVLAYRTETNAAAIKDGLHDACEARVATATQYNVGREALVQLAVNGPNAPKDPAQKAVMVKQLRDGLLLPIEDCGL